MPLLELSVEVERSGADALSEALIEQGAQSVSIEAPDTPHPLLRALFADALALQSCRPLLPGPGEVREVAERDWVRASQAQFEPCRAGRLWIGASWHEPPADAVVVRIDPGLAFGTGSHATTQLCLRFLDQTLRAGESVLDYGCGSGILALAAARLGAGTVHAVDIDPVAVEVARANARANSLEVACSLASNLPAGQYEVVVANILSRPLVELAPVLCERVAPGGSIALAGLLEAQAEEVARAYRDAFAIGRTGGNDGWALLSGRRR